MFTIIANRSGNSIFGAASAPLKNADGSFCEFETREQAEAEAKSLNEVLKTRNVRYTVEQTN